MVPSRAEPVRNASMTPRVNTDSWNMRGGRIGSTARRSFHTSNTNSSTVAAARPTITTDSQGYSVPPQLSTSRKHVTPPVSRVAPI